METNKCLRCDHTWIVRTEDPVMCPRCKSHKWNEQIEEDKE